MIEIIVVLLIVAVAALYWYARLFPRGWRRLRSAMGLPVPEPAIGAGACAGCKGCGKSGSGGCH